MPKVSSPNFDKRAGGDPTMIILHYTGMGSALEALEALCDKVAKVSAHYFIDEDGSVFNLVKEEKRAWHAGNSFWEGKTDINSASIGIEIVNPGHEYGYRAFPARQMEAVAELCAALCKTYNIKPRHVLGHSDVAPERKSDPGELFDWKWLAEKGIGLWPDVQDMDREAAGDVADNDYAFERLLQDYGYNPLAAYQDTVTAFHRHFYPEKFQDGEDPSQIDQTSAERLLALIRAAHNG